MGFYTRDDYVAAYCFFGWRLKKAEELYKQGKRDDALVREYKRIQRDYIRGLLAPETA